MDHFGGNVESFIYPVVADHHRHDDHIAAHRLQMLVHLEEPADREIGLLLAMKLSRTESLLVLVHSGDLVVRDDLLEHLAVDVVALQGLTWLAAAEDVAARREPFVDHADARRVLVVSERVAKLDSLSARDEHLDEEVEVGLVKRHKDNLIVPLDKLLDSRN